MSRKVVIDYEGVSIEAQAQCETAVHSLCSIDKTLERIKNNASKLRNEAVRNYEDYLLRSKSVIQDKIEDFKQSLEKYKSMKSKVVDDMSSTYHEFADLKTLIESKMQSLISITNELTGSKLEVINEMINQALLDVGSEVMKEAKGIVCINQEILKQINSIEDVSLRELSYKEALNNKDLSFDELLELAKNRYDEILNGATEKVVASYKEELVKQGISTEALNNVSNIDEAKAATSKAIADEKIRKETLKVIIKSIKDRGFIVDTKHNLKIDKERNIVKLVALKASGQKAEFEISLDGKFMYHFDNYEGHACKKDIEPFLEDLHNIYDINILHEEITWENPDKIQTQKYQHINKNKGTN